MDAKKIIEIEDLQVFYNTASNMFVKNNNYVRAVDKVSLNIFEKETLGLVGESGCGKSHILSASVQAMIRRQDGNVHLLSISAMRSALLNIRLNLYH